MVAILPAHNEEKTLEQAIDALRTQTRPPDRIIVASDNSTDNTLAVGRCLGVEIIETRGNTEKKAGALNQVLAGLVPTLRNDDLILIQDADSLLDSHFIEAATFYLRRGYGGVGGVFRGAEGGGFVGHLQRNEYARYARDVNRLNGKCLVITGTDLNGVSRRSTAFGARSIARYTVERATPNSSANSALVCSPA